MLTKRQEVIFDFVREYQRTHGVAPSTREVARQFKRSQPTVLKHLRAIGRKMHLDKLADGKWGLSVKNMREHAMGVPVYGAIPAGLPTAQEQESEESIAIDPAIFGVRRGRPGQFWLLRVIGDSMIGAKIFDGDLVALVRRDPRPGDIIAALVDETTTTLKRLVREKGRMILRAENPAYPDIIPQKFESQGVAVGVIRRSLA